MAYDETLAARVRDALVGRETIVERKMFGGLGFLYHGNMCTGVRGDALIVTARRPGRRGARRTARAPVLERRRSPATMTGWVLVDPPGIESDRGARGLGRPRGRLHRIAAAEVAAYIRVYSGPDPPSGGVSRPPLAVIAPHCTQFDGAICTRTWPSPVSEPSTIS